MSNPILSVLSLTGNKAASFEQAASDIAIALKPLYVSGQSTRIQDTIDALPGRFSGLKRAIEGIRDDAVDVRYAHKSEWSTVKGGKWATPPTVDVDAIRLNLKKALIGKQAEQALLPALIVAHLQRLADSRQASVDGRLADLDAAVIAAGTDVVALQAAIDDRAAFVFMQWAMSQANTAYKPDSGALLEKGKKATKAALSAGWLADELPMVRPDHSTVQSAAFEFLMNPIWNDATAEYQLREAWEAAIVEDANHSPIEAAPLPDVPVQMIELSKHESLLAGVVDQNRNLYAQLQDARNRAAAERNQSLAREGQMKAILDLINSGAKLADIRATAKQYAA